MSKLLEDFKASPTRDNAKRIAKHCRKHPFAALLISSEEHAILQQALTVMMSPEGN